MCRAMRAVLCVQRLAPAACAVLCHAARAERELLCAAQVSLSEQQQLGACGGWLLSDSTTDTKLLYKQLWSGSLDELAAGLTFGPIVQVSAAPRLTHQHVSYIICITCY